MREQSSIEISAERTAFTGSNRPFNNLNKYVKLSDSEMIDRKEFIIYRYHAFVQIKVVRCDVTSSKPVAFFFRFTVSLQGGGGEGEEELTERKDFV